MEPVIGLLASTVVTILTPYVKQTAEAFIETAGETAYEKAKALFGTLKTRWVGKPAAANLEEFQQDPDGSKEVLEAVLKKQLDSDPSLREDVDRHVQDVGPFLHVLQKMGRAEGVTGVDAEEIARGQIHVRQEAIDAKDVTAIRAKRIG